MTPIVRKYAGTFTHLCVFFQVVPVPMVQPLPEQLNRRLGSVLLSGRHVQIIHKNNLNTLWIQVNEAPKYLSIMVVCNNTSSNTAWWGWPNQVKESFLNNWASWLNFFWTHGFPSHGWAKDSLPSLVKLWENDILRLVGTGLCREVDEDWLVDILGQFVQNKILKNNKKGKKSG